MVTKFVRGFVTQAALPIVWHDDWQAELTLFLHKEKGQVGIGELFLWGATGGQGLDVHSCSKGAKEGPGAMTTRVIWHRG
jgi:hypothetical protein